MRTPKTLELVRLCRDVAKTRGDAASSLSSSGRGCSLMLSIVCLGHQPARFLPQHLLPWPPACTMSASTPTVLATSLRNALSALATSLLYLRSSQCSRRLVGQQRCVTSSGHPALGTCLGDAGHSMGINVFFASHVGDSLACAAPPCTKQATTPMYKRLKTLIPTECLASLACC